MAVLNITDHWLKFLLVQTFVQYVEYNNNMREN